MTRVRIRTLHAPDLVLRPYASASIRSRIELKGIDTLRLVRTLQSHGIRVLGSTIIGLEEHRPENIDAAIEHAVAHDTEFHQFMLYTPLGGTPLHAQHLENGTLLDGRECPEADRRWFRSDPVLESKIARTLGELYREFGLKARAGVPLVGRYLRFMMRREDRRLRRGWTYEPPTFRETTNQRILPDN